MIRDVFTKEMVSLNSEVLAMIQTKAKAASLITAKEYTANLSFDLAFSLFGPVFAYSAQRAIITVSTSSNALAGISYGVDIADDDLRVIRSRPNYDSSTDKIGYSVSMLSYSQADIETLFNGGTVTVDVPVTITTTGDATISVEYIDV